MAIWRISHRISEWTCVLKTILGLSSNLIHEPREIKGFSKFIEPLRSKLVIKIQFPEHKATVHVHVSSGSQFLLLAQGKLFRLSISKCHSSKYLLTSSFSSTSCFFSGLSFFSFLLLLPLILSFLFLLLADHPNASLN